MIKTAHETPLASYDLVKSLTDYEYFLVHLFYENPAYLSRFRERERGTCILDNSIFELGTAWPQEQFFEWVNELEAGEQYIIPDALEDTQGTILAAEKWFKTFATRLNPDIKSIGVVQGKTYNELVECYKFMDANVDKIAISFDYSLYMELTSYYAVHTLDTFGDETNRWKRLMKGRQFVIDRLVQDNVINRGKPHHLLGAALPQEFRHYVEREYKFIDSLDTSNPVVAGLTNKRYSSVGLQDKNTKKLIEFMDEPVTLAQNIDIAYNIIKFREINGL